MNSEDLYDLYIDIMDVIFDIYNNVDKITYNEVEIYFNKIRKHFIKKNDKILLEKKAEQKGIETTEELFIKNMDNTWNDIKNNIKSIEFYRSKRRYREIKHNNTITFSDEYNIPPIPKDNVIDDNLLNNINVDNVFNPKNKRKVVFLLKTESSIKKQDLINKIKAKRNSFEDCICVKENIENSNLNNYYFYLKTKSPVVFPFKNYKDLEYEEQGVNRNQKKALILSKGEKINI